MLKGILPKEYAFFDFFDEHIQITIQICKEFKSLTEAPTKILEYVEKIDKLEKEADKIHDTCTEALHKTFITPIERSDIFNIIKRMDDIADNMRTASNRMSIYEITEIRDEAKEMADILLNSTTELKEAIFGLRNIKKPDVINEKCALIHKLENDADEILRKAITRLFKEKDTVLIIKWKEIFERLEKAVDRCDNLANLIEGVLIDNA